LAQNTSTKRRAVTIHPPARLVGEPKKTKKKERKEGKKIPKSQNSGKLAIRPDHPRRGIKIKLCMVGGLGCVVIHVKCDPNRLRGYGAVGVEIGPSLFTLASGLYKLQQLVLPYKTYPQKSKTMTMYVTYSTSASCILYSATVAMSYKKV